MKKERYSITEGINEKKEIKKNKRRRQGEKINVRESEAKKRK